jgi:hypothetical protein
MQTTKWKRGLLKRGCPEPPKAEMLVYQRVSIDCSIYSLGWIAVIGK